METLANTFFWLHYVSQVFSKCEWLNLLKIIILHSLTSFTFLFLYSRMFISKCKKMLFFFSDHLSVHFHSFMSVYVFPAQRYRESGLVPRMHHRNSWCRWVEGLDGSGASKYWPVPFLNILFFNCSPSAPHYYYFFFGHTFCSHRENWRLKTKRSFAPKTSCTRSSGARWGVSCSVDFLGCSTKAKWYHSMCYFFLLTKKSELRDLTHFVYIQSKCIP